MYVIVAYQMKAEEATACSLVAIVDHSEELVSEVFERIAEKPRQENQILRAIPVEVGDIWLERLMPFSYLEVEAEE